jgi:hypothetical protein
MVADTSGMVADTSGGGDDVAVGVPTFTGQIQAFYQGSCGLCHTGPNRCSGGACFALSYAETQKTAGSCAGKTLGECTLDRINDGSMPPGGSVSVTDRALLEAWINGGMPE